MTKKSLIPRLAALAAAALLGAFALGASVLAQPAPPHQFYGDGLSEGETVGLGDMSAEVDANGEWFIQTTSDIADDADENSFTIDGEAATAVLTSKGNSLTHVALTKVVAVEEPVCPDDAMMAEGDSADSGDAMTAEDSMESEDGMTDETAMQSDDAMLDCPEEGDEDGSMTDDGDDAMLDEDVGMPATGTGGLADGGLSAGLIGLLIALGAATIAGLGIRRVRNRA